MRIHTLDAQSYIIMDCGFNTDKLEPLLVRIHNLTCDAFTKQARETLTTDHPELRLLVSDVHINFIHFKTIFPSTVT